MPYDFRGRLSFSWPRSPNQTPLNADTEPYYPLFALGYGLDYAHPHDIGELPEAPPSALPTENVDHYVADGKTGVSVDCRAVVQRCACVADG